MGRSGSTILETILGQAEGCISVGELKFVWERGLLDNRRCGCGVPFRSCPFWTEVFQRAVGGMEGVRLDEVMAASDKTRTRHFPLMMLPGSELFYKRKHTNYLDMLGRLYRSIAQVSGAKLIVDSSKYPSHAYMLRLIDNFDVRVLHLTRDPRAVANSWMRQKYDPDQDVPTLMPIQPPWLNAIYWSTWNIAIETLGRRGKRPYLRLRYEDVMKEPESTVREILAFAGIEAQQLPFIDHHRVEVEPNHTVSGNPIRFNTGIVELRTDERWRTQMPSPAATLVASMTWPLRKRYGY